MQEGCCASVELLFVRVVGTCGWPASCPNLIRGTNRCQDSKGSFTCIRFPDKLGGSICLGGSVTS